MDFINNLLVPLSWPANGLWENIIKWFAGVGNFGVAVILLTLCIKVLLLPLDFWNKSVSRKMTANNALMQPELEKIKQKYANNPQVMQQKQAEIYRKYNGQKGMQGSCIAMLVYMIVTMVVFFTLFSGLGNISRTRINYEYYQLQEEYKVAYAETGNEEQAQERVAQKYDKIREGFLSIKNIWRPDNWSSVFPNSNDFIKSTNTSFRVFDYEKDTTKVKYIYLSTNSKVLKDADNIKYVEPYTDLDGNIYLVRDTADGALNPSTLELNGKTYNCLYGTVDETYKTEKDATLNLAKTQFKTDFDLVTAGINQKYSGQWNGFLILVALAGIITFLSSFLSTLGVKTKDSKGNEIKGARPKPIMGIVLSLVMVFFTISYTSAFAIYIITNSLLSTLFTFLMNLLLNKIEQKKNSDNVQVAKYVRR